MSTPSYARSLASSFKRLKLSPITQPLYHHHQTRPISSSTAKNADIEAELSALRLPKAVQATYLNPLKRRPTHGILTADLQLRSYSVRNLELFADFALRAAYYLHLPAAGPNPLPRITERWTVPRSNFVHKKSQENFSRQTLRRKIEVYDGHSETVAVWLAFLKKYQYYGVGLKANVWEYGGLAVGEDMEKEAKEIGKRLGELFDLFGGRRSLLKGEETLAQRLLDEPFKAQWGATAASAGAQSVPHANKRIETIVINQS